MHIINDSSANCRDIEKIFTGIVDHIMVHTAPALKLTWIAFSSRKVDGKKNRILQDSDPGDVHQDLRVCMSTPWVWVNHIPKQSFKRSSYRASRITQSLEVASWFGPPSGKHRIWAVKLEKCQLLHLKRMEMISVKVAGYLV